MRYDLDNPNAVPHSFASQFILESKGIDISISSVAGGHHGVFPSRDELFKIKSFKNHMGVKYAEWNSVHNELLGYALHLSKLDFKNLFEIKISIHAQILLTALVIMSDWISSDEYNFPYDEEFKYTDKILMERVVEGWKNLDLPPVWISNVEDITELLYQIRFGFNPRPFQKSVVDILNNVSSPGIFVMEAPMGEGKTEAALVAAEILAERFEKSGLFFALPTQATSDGIFDRLYKWMQKAVGNYDDEVHSLFLAHGKSQFNKLYTSLYQDKWNVGNDTDRESENGNVIVHEWLKGRKKGILSDVVVGTVDQILMAGLKQKHLVLRHLGLANKVVIIDECHAYDSYMGSYLVKTLRWLGSYNVPVILLSATLPPKRRYDLISEYTNCAEGCGIDGILPDWALNKKYPLITYSENKKIHQKEPSNSGRNLRVFITNISDEEILKFLDEHTSEGGFVGIILNTVKRAQDLSMRLSKYFGEEHVSLLHSRFTNIDRTTKETEVLKLLGEGDRLSEKNRHFIVGTQVIEQSLDLDFDLIITDLCPMDLLIQRMGRLHRHVRNRSKKVSSALCCILDSGCGDYEAGSVNVYGQYHLMNTRELLKDKKFIDFPDEIPILVHAAYDVNGVPMPDDFVESYKLAFEDFEKKMLDKERRARIFQIKNPEKTKNLLGWTYGSTFDSEKTAEATVRDIDGSLDVIIIRKDEGNNFRMISSSGDNGIEVPKDSVPSGELAFKLAGCKVALPRTLSANWIIDKTIRELETKNNVEIPRCWYESEWLKGELFLVLDSEFTTRLISILLRYDTKFGLVALSE